MLKVKILIKILSSSVIEPADAMCISKTSVHTDRTVGGHTRTASSDSFWLPPSRSVEITSCACMYRRCANLDPFRLVRGTLTTVAGLCSPHTYTWITNESELWQLLLVRSFVLSAVRLYFFPHNQPSTHSEGLPIVITCLNDQVQLSNSAQFIYRLHTQYFVA
jgi:hypothetical protein